MTARLNAPWYPDTNWAELAPFFNGLRSRELRFPQCSQCTRFQWYPQELCPRCGTPSLVWSNVEPAGIVYSWTIVRRAFLSEYAPIVPATIGLISIDDAPSVRLVANVLGGGGRDPEIGERVHIEFEDVGNGVTLPVAAIGDPPTSRVIA